MGIHTMKRLQYLFLFVIICLFFSCSVYISDTNFDENDFVNKTTMKTFEHLNEPFIISKTITEYSHNIFNKDKTKRNYLGGINIVIDWETDTVYDWVYSKYSGVYPVPVAMGQDYKKYYNYIGNSKFSIIDPQSSELRIIKTSEKCDYFYNYSTPGNYSITYTGYGYDDSSETPGMITKLQVFDAEIEDIKKKFVTFTEGNNFNAFFHSDPCGYLWFRIDREDEVLIAKVDGKNEKIEYLNSKLDRNIDNYGIDKKKFNYHVPFIGSDIGFIYKCAIVVTDIDEKRVNQIYEFNPQNKDTEFVSYKMNVLDSDFISDILEVNGFYYGVSFTPNKDEDEVHIYFIDTQNRTVDLYTEEKVVFNYYWKAEVRKNRIYLIDHGANETAFIYFDTDKKKFSEIVTFKTQDIIKEK